MIIEKRTVAGTLIMATVIMSIVLISAISADKQAFEACAKKHSQEMCARMLSR